MDSTGSDGLCQPFSRGKPSIFPQGHLLLVSEDADAMVLDQRQPLEAFVELAQAADFIIGEDRRAAPVFPVVRALTRGVPF